MVRRRVKRFRVKRPTNIRVIEALSTILSDTKPSQVKSALLSIAADTKLFELIEQSQKYVKALKKKGWTDY